MGEDELDEDVLNAIDVYDPKTFPGGKYPEPTVDQPCIELIEGMAVGLVDAEATDGCPCDPDGVCPHGHPSWLVVNSDFWGR